MYSMYRPSFLLHVCLYVYVLIQPLAAKPNKSINQSACDLNFRFEFNRNYEAILYRFRVIVAYFQKLKKSRDNDHAPFRDNLLSVG